MQSIAPGAVRTRRLRIDRLESAMVQVVCGLIEDGNGRLLACRRPSGKHLGGLWEFPGGKVEADESSEAALIRELREELGIETEITGALSPVEWDYGRGPIRLIPFFCRIVSGTPHPHEHDALEWVDAATCDRLAWADADGPILAEWKTGVSVTSRTTGP